MDHFANALQTLSSSSTRLNLTNLLIDHCWTPGDKTMACPLLPASNCAKIATQRDRSSVRNFAGHPKHIENIIYDDRRNCCWHLNASRPDQFSLCKMTTDFADYTAASVFSVELEVERLWTVWYRYRTLYETTALCLSNKKTWIIAILTCGLA